jgi:hypothetical protein
LGPNIAHDLRLHAADDSDHDHIRVAERRDRKLFGADQRQLGAAMAG